MKDSRLTQRRLPVLRSLITLSLVDVVGDSDKLGVGEIIGESLAAGGSP